jgi:hypothetical protein
MASLTSPAELLVELHRLGGVVHQGYDRRPVIARVPPSTELVCAVRRWRWVLVWGLQGAISGFLWHACDQCGQIRLTKSPGRCTLTPRCLGSEKPVPGPRFVSEAWDYGGMERPTFAGGTGLSASQNARTSSDPRRYLPSSRTCARPNAAPASSVTVSSAASPTPEED